jgi:hypothetical protein
LIEERITDIPAAKDTAPPEGAVGVRGGLKIKTPLLTLPIPYYPLLTLERLCKE